MHANVDFLSISERSEVKQGYTTNIYVDIRKLNLRSQQDALHFFGVLQVTYFTNAANLISKLSQSRAFRGKRIIFKKAILHYKFNKQNK